MTAPPLCKVEAYRQANEQCAAIVLAAVAKYGGEESLMVRWARLVLNPPTERSRPEIGRPASA